MPALTINGLAIPVVADSFREQPIDSGDVFERATTNKMFGSFGARKRRWSCGVNYLDSITANALRMFVEGNALSWAFNGDSVSGGGVSETNVASITYVTGKWGSAARIASGTAFAVNMADKLNVSRGWSPTKGWTMMFWAYHTIAADSVPADGWYHYIVTGAVSVTRGASANPVGVTQYRNGIAGNYNLGRVINVATSGDLVGVAGVTLAGVNAAKDYDDLVFLPFLLPTTPYGFTSTWASQLYVFANANAWPAAPVVSVSGQHIDDVETLAMCFIADIEHRNMTLPGSTSAPNVKTMQLVIEEF